MVFLKRKLYNCTPDIKFITYNTFVQPLLVYYIVVWYPNTKHILH